MNFELKENKGYNEPGNYGTSNTNTWHAMIFLSQRNLITTY